MSKQKTALVCGAGGFIGNAMCNRLKSEGYWVRGVDLKYPEFSETVCDEFIIADLTNSNKAHDAIFIDEGFDELYQFAACMGGCQYIFTGENDADIFWNSMQINLNVAKFASVCGVRKLFFSSSACAYPESIQSGSDSIALKESDIFPASPDSIYGWEKIAAEILYESFLRNKGLNIRIARFHNIYGPLSTFNGGKEKAPASICRKVAESPVIHWDHQPFEKAPVKMWGNGEQKRSFLFIDDCIDAVRLLMESDYTNPINIGSEESVTIKQLWETAIEVSGFIVKIESVTRPENTLGVVNRNSDNTLIREILNWEPKHSLKSGIEKTYKWIYKQVNQ